VIAVRILGHSGAGKTTLIERLLPALAEQGRVASIKSIHHPVEIDTEGKDTHRHRTAGAERVVGITPALTAAFETRGKDDYGSEAAALEALLGDLRDRGFEYVVVEGFSAASSLPAIVVGGRDGDGGDEGGAGDEGDGSDASDGRTVVASVDDADGVDVGALVERIDALDPWTGAA